MKNLRKPEEIFEALAEEVGVSKNVALKLCKAFEHAGFSIHPIAAAVTKQPSGSQVSAIHSTTKKK